MISGSVLPNQVLLPISRIYAVPRECYASFVWLMDMCKHMDIRVDEVTFTSTDAGEFLSAEGAVCLDQRSARFMVSERWSPGHMKVYVLLGAKRYCVHSDHVSHDAEPVYPLDGVMHAGSEEEIEAMASAMGGMGL